MRVKFLYCILTVSSALQAGDVTTEIKRKLEKKEKKRKKRESKLHEEVNGGANGTAEIKVMTSALLCPGMFDLGSCHPLGFISVYGVPYQNDSEPLAGPIQWTKSLKRVRHQLAC